MFLCDWYGALLHGLLLVSPNCQWWNISPLLKLLTISSVNIRVIPCENLFCDCCRDYDTCSCAFDVLVSMISAYTLILCVFKDMHGFKFDILNSVVGDIMLKYITYCYFQALTECLSFEDEKTFVVYDDMNVLNVLLPMSVTMSIEICEATLHDDVIKWKHFPRYWPFVWGIHRSPVNSPHKGQWRGTLMFSLIYVWINGWVNNREAGDLRRNRVHNDVIVMLKINYVSCDFLRNITDIAAFHIKISFCLFSATWVISALIG